MPDVATHRFAYGSRIRRVAIRRDLIPEHGQRPQRPAGKTAWPPPCSSSRSAEKPPDGHQNRELDTNHTTSHAPSGTFRQHPRIFPPVHVAWFVTALLSVEQTAFPISDSLMRKHKAAFEKHFGDITQAQFGAEPPHNRQEDDVRREFQRVKRSTSSFIEDRSAMWTEEHCIAKPGLLCSFSGACRGAMGAVHCSIFLGLSEC